MSFGPWIARLKAKALWVVFVLVCLQRPTSAAQAENLAGVYRDEQITVELGPPSESPGRTTYAGTIQMGERKFPLKAATQAGRLRGTFESEGASFDFEGSVADRVLVFTTDGTTYRLKKQPTNPLARPAAPSNPLASAASPASVEPPVSPAPPETNTLPQLPRLSDPVPKPAARLLHLRRYSLLDRATMIGGEAFSLLIPTDWQMDGGLAWRMHASAPVYMALRVFSSNRTEMVEAFPAIPFVWMEGGIPLFPVGSTYVGNEVGEPIEDPATYITRIIIPRFRPGLAGVRTIGAEALPLVAEAVGEGPRDASVQRRTRAARVRIEYAESGKMMEEDFYCVLTVIDVPASRTTYWGPERNFSFRAEKGRLDRQTGLFQAIVSSYRANLMWFNRYLQLQQILGQIQLDTSRPVGELGRYAAQTSDEITEARRQIYDRQQSTQDRINSKFAQSLRGVDQYRSPFDQRPVALPAGYQQVWASSAGDFLLSDDASFNPNTGKANSWRKVDRVAQ
ncbi:MAG: hypothetical protein U1G07_19605 [Verrucomicrobiota bacterium]